MELITALIYDIDDEELQGEYDDIKPLTPTGTRDWYVKWGSMILGVLGIFLISAEIYLLEAEKLSKNNSDILFIVAKMYELTDRLELFIICITGNRLGVRS